MESPGPPILRLDLAEHETLVSNVKDMRAVGGGESPSSRHMAHAARHIFVPRAAQRMAAAVWRSARTVLCVLRKGKTFKKSDLLSIQTQ